ncbi:hypothetical protein Tco_1028161 [Tanacetum coccineum]
MTHVTALYFSHATLIRWDTSSSILLNLCIIDARYLKDSLGCGILDDVTEYSFFKHLRASEDLAEETSKLVDMQWLGSDEVFSIWKTFGGNTCDLGSFEEETDDTPDLHQHCSRISPQKLETASQITRDAVTNPTTTASQDIAMASARTIQPII